LAGDFIAQKGKKKNVTLEQEEEKGRRTTRNLFLSGRI
jgi:hypothetical protein